LKGIDPKESARRAAIAAIEDAGEVEKEAYDAAKAQLQPRSREAFQKQLQALREQLDSIEREKQRIREQIQRLEQKRSEVEKGDSDLERPPTGEN
jgi:chromosome segregation ATPase